jgi:hypothetical protein
VNFRERVLSIAPIEMEILLGRATKEPPQEIVMESGRISIAAQEDNAPV